MPRASDEAFASAGPAPGAARKRKTEATMEARAGQAENPFRVHLRVVGALMRREMTTRYGRSAGGYFWAIAEPIAVIALLSLVFSTLARTPSLGRSFPVFFATGYIAYSLYRNTADQISTAIRANKALLRYPNVNPWDAIVAAGTLQLLTECMIAALILPALIVATGEPVLIAPEWLLGALAAAAILAFGVGSVNAVMFVVHPIYERIYKILMRPLFIISGIFFLPEALPSQLRELLALNPVVHIVAAFREGVYPVYHATLDRLEYPIILGLTLCLLGQLLARRHAERLDEL